MAIYPDQKKEVEIVKKIRKKVVEIQEKEQQKDELNLRMAPLEEAEKFLAIGEKKENVQPKKKKAIVAPNIFKSFKNSFKIFFKPFSPVFIGSAFFLLIVIILALIFILNAELINNWFFSKEYYFKIVGEDGKPIEAVSVSITSSDKRFFAESDDGGEFKLVLPSNIVRVLAQKGGFEVFEEELSLSNAAVTKIVLKKVEIKVIEETEPNQQEEVKEIKDVCAWTLDLENFKSESKPLAAQARQYNLCYNESYILKVTSLTSLDFCNEIVDDVFLLNCLAVLARKTSNLNVCSSALEKNVFISEIQHEVAVSDACNYKYVVSYNQLIEELQELEICNSISDEKLKNYCITTYIQID